MKERNVAVALARQAGAIILEAWQRDGLQVEEKGLINLVTEVDRQAEELITRGLVEAFPDYGILSEEGTTRKQSGSARWIVDPLDGTTNFIKGYPMVAVSIGLEKDGALVLGVVYNPVRDEMFVGERGLGATLNGAPIMVSETVDLRKALVGSGFPYDSWENPDDNTAEWTAFVKNCLSVRCDGSAALDLCHVACGRLDGYWEQGISAWDMAAGAVIAAEAGALVCDYEAGPAFLEKRRIVAANPLLATRILDLLHTVRDS